jgi:DNA-binding CsgD family transcriptional regulator
MQRETEIRNLISFGLSLEEIGARLGISKQRVHQICNKLDIPRLSPYRPTAKVMARYEASVGRQPSHEARENMRVSSIRKWSKRGARRQRQDVRDKEIRRVMDGTKTYAELIVALQMSKSGVKMACDRLGLKIKLLRKPVSGIRKQKTPA